MNNQTIHNLREVIRELNENILNFVEYIGAKGPLIGDPLTVSDLEETLQDLSKDMQLNPNNPVLYINRGKAYSYVCNYERAISDYSRAIQINPENPKVYINRGGVHLRKGAYDEAISDYNKAIQINPEYAEAYDERGEAFHRKGESDKARADYDKALKLGFDLETHAKEYNFELIENLVQIFPRNAKLYYYRGLIHDCTGDYNLAIEDYSAVIELDPQGAEFSYRNRAKIYEAIADNAYYCNADYDKAIVYYDKAISDYDKFGEVEYFGGYNRYYRIYGDEGEPIYEEAPIYGIPIIEVFLKEGELYAEKGDYDKAIETMSEVIRRDDCFRADYDEVVLGIRDIYLDEDLWVSDDRRSSKFGSELAGKAYNNRGVYYFKKGKHNLAIEDLTEALRIYKECIELFPESNPDFAIMYLNLGSTYHAKGDIKLAIETYDNVVRLCPNYVTDFINSAFAHGGQEQADRATELLDKAVEDCCHSDNLAAAAYYSGVSILFRDNRHKARRRFEKARELGFNDSVKIETHLKNLKPWFE